jgi:WD40 repeat protein
VIAGYQIVQELGRGGMGVVYLARHVRLRRYVALKMILAGYFASAEALARFATEAEAVAQLQHPGIVQIYEVGETEGRPYLALEYVEGGPLPARLDGTPWPPLAAARFIEALAHAIHHAHLHGIVHRDLKPQNVLLAPAPDNSQERTPSSHWSLDVAPKIADFGLAKKLEGDSSQTKSGAILGTPSYMAPEQADALAPSISPRADVYALGALLYELLTGRPPFLAANPFDTMLQVVKQDPVPPRRLVAQTPRDLETICLACLEKSPARRFASAAQLAEELRRYQQGTPILSRPAGRLERTWRWCRRNPAEALLTGAVFWLLLMLALGATLSALWLRQERNLARQNETQALVNLERANRAEKEALDKLGDSLLAQARSLRWSGQPGRHFDSLEVLTQAVPLRPALSVRNEALACLPLIDLRLSPLCRGKITDEYSSVSFDADLARYACSDARGNIIIRRVAGDKELLRLPGPGQPCWVVRFSPEGNYLAAKYHPVQQNLDNRVILWDLKQGKKLFELPGLEHEAMDFRPDDSQLVFGKGRTLTLHALPGGAQLRRCTISCLPHTVRFHPRESRRLAVSSFDEKTVLVVDTETGKAEKSLPLATAIRGVSWNATGRLLAAAGNDRRVYLWDAERAFAGTVLEGHQGPVTEIAFHPAGDLLASLSWDATIRLWDLHAWQQVLAFPGIATKGSPCLGFSRDGQSLAHTIVGRDVRTFDVHPGVECRQLHAGEVWEAHLSPDGRWLAVSQPDGFALWDVCGAREIARWPGNLTRSAFFSTDGRRLLTWGTAGLEQWPLLFDGAGNCTGAGKRQSLGVSATAQPEYGAMSQDGRYVAGGDRGTQEVFALDQTKGKVCFRQRYRNPSRVALSPDGRWLAAAPWADVDAVVRVWDLQTGKEAAAFKEPNGTRLAFTADGQWLVTGTRHAYRFRTPGSATPAHEIETEGQGSGCLAVHPSQPLAAICIKPGFVRLVDTATFQERATYPAGDPLHFNATGTHLVTLSDRSAVQVWDLVTLRGRLRLLGLDWDPSR